MFLTLMKKSYFAIKGFYLYHYTLLQLQFVLLGLQIHIDGYEWLLDFHKLYVTALRSVYDSVGTTMDWMRTSPRQSRCVGIRSWGKRGSGYRWQRTRSSSSRGPRTSSPRKRSRKVRILEGCIQDYFCLVFFFHPTLNNFAICHVLTYGNTKCINFPVNFLLINELLFKNRLVLDFSLMTRAEIKQCENCPVYITLQFAFFF